MSYQGKSSSFPDLTCNKRGSCWYVVDIYIKNGTREDCIYVFIRREEDGTACFLQDEVKTLGLREAGYSKPFQWKRSGQLKIDISIGNLHRTKKIKREKVEEMNFLENVIVRLAKDTGADTTTLTLNIKDEEDIRKKLILSEDVKITLKKPLEEEETGQATEHSLEELAQPVGQPPEEEETGQAPEHSIEPPVETGQATGHTEDPAEPVWQGFSM